MKNVPDPRRDPERDSRLDPAYRSEEPAHRPEDNIPVIEESRGHARWVPPLIAIAVLLIFVIGISLYFL